MLYRIGKGFDTASGIACGVGVSVRLACGVIMGPPEEIRSQCQCVGSAEEQLYRGNR